MQYLFVHWDVLDKPLVADIVKTWLKLARNRKTIVFSTSVGHSRHLEKEFRKHGVKACEVNGYMSKEETQYEVGANKIIDDFRSGEFQVIISVEMLVAGFDVTDVSCVVFATATKSIMKWCQAVGRGLRHHDGIDECIILDHGSNATRLGFPDEYEFLHLDDGKKSDSKSKAKERPDPLPKKCPSCDFVKPASIRKCPACGFEPKFVQDVEVEDGKLEKLQRKAKREFSLAEKQSFLSQLNQYADDKNYKAGKNGCYGWSIKKYEAKFGSAPASRLKWNLREPVQEEVRKFIVHENIKWAKRKKEKF